jgi:hypothetical protein
LLHTVQIQGANSGDGYVTIKAISVVAPEPGPLGFLLIGLFILLASAMVKRGTRRRASDLLRRRSIHIMKNGRAVFFPSVAGLLLTAVTSHATTVYTSQSAFVKDLAPAYYLETFDNVDFNNLPNTLNFSGNGYSYQGVASGGYSYGNGTFYGTYENFFNGFCYCNTGNPILSVTQDGTNVTLTFSSNVTAVGGNLFMMNNNIDVTSGTMFFTLADGEVIELLGGDAYGTTYILPGGTVVNSSTSPPFTGFTSTSPIVSLSIDSNRFTALDNLYVGTSLESTAVPEPWTAGLLLAAFPLLLIARRPVRKLVPRSSPANVSSLRA